jgi:rare lipoprotein A (peptidoglycan hydrolase)
VHHRRINVREGHKAVVAGRVVGAPRALSLLQVWRGSRWHTLDRARTGVRGRYRLHRRLHRTMSAPARVVVAAHGQRRRHPIGRLNVYRWAQASWYGPGLYGGHLACGGHLEPGTIGVANKTLPCGTRLTLRRGSRSLRVRVIDRGPYVAGREFDLTAATAHRLGFAGHGAILTTR